jgi:TrmH family RNA methyltransferase
VEGVKNVLELLNATFSIKYFICTQKSAPRFREYNPKIVTEKTLQSLTTLKNNQDCLAVAEAKSAPQVKLASLDQHLIVLDGISDPGNLGTIIRTLDWFGHSKLICSPDCAEFYSPKTIAASMGSFTRLMPQYLDLSNFLNQSSRVIYGLELSGTALPSLTIKHPAIFVIGSESQGISESVKKCVSHRLTIPGEGKAESLNAAQACGILAYHLSLKS